MTGFPQIDAYRGGPGLIRVIGHRGARGVMPENTLEGFRFTLDLGVDALEFDVVLTRDEVPVVTHNHLLSPAAVRGSDGEWLAQDDLAVADFSLAELQRFDVGGVDSCSTYGRKYPDQAFLSGVGIPSLADLMALVSEPKYANASLLLELKTEPNDPQIADIRRRQVAAVLREVRAHNLADRTVLHSFDWVLLDECRRQAPDIPTSYLSMLATMEEAAQPQAIHATTSLPEIVAAAGGQMWCPWFRDVSPELVAKAHELGLPVAVWTVNERADIEAMIDLGVDGIVTDYPGRVQQCLLARGLTWSPRISVPTRAG